MKNIIVSFAFFIVCSPMCLAATTDDVCAHSTQGVHSVSENPYRKLLARLNGNDNDRKKMNYKKKRKKKEWGTPGTGQR